MWTPPLGPQQELLWGHEALCWVGQTHVDTATGALGGAPYGPPGPRSAVLDGGDARGHHHWGLRWSSLWGHEALCWVGETVVDTATGALGGAPYGARKR
eukprot:457522-Pyramimonas_sp.AAC.1